MRYQPLTKAKLDSIEKIRKCEYLGYFDSNYECALSVYDLPQDLYFFFL